MSNSPLRGVCRAAHLVPAAHFLRPGCRVVVLCLHRISAASAGASAGWYPKILGVSCSPGPEMRGRRSAGRRPASVSQSRSVRRDLTFAEGHATSRRSTVALRPRHRSGQAPAGRLLAAGHCSWPATAPGFSSRLYAPRSTPLPAPPAGSSPETALMSEDGKPLLYIRYVVNNILRIVVAKRRVRRSICTIPSASARASPHAHPCPR